MTRSEGTHALRNNGNAGGDSADADSAGGAPVKQTSVAVMARRAELGKGKRRIAATAGDERAHDIYRALIRSCAAVVAESGLAATVYFDPVPGDRDIWDEDHFTYSVQPHGADLGTRLRMAAEESMTRYGGSVLLIGTDCPTLTPELLREAADALRDHDAVLGASTDGGYYLLGLTAIEPRLFLDIAWSTDAVAAQTRAVLAKAQLRTYELPRLTDIDTEADWLAYRQAHKA